MARVTTPAGTGVATVCMSIILTILAITSTCMDSVHASTTTTTTTTSGVSLTLLVRYPSNQLPAGITLALRGSACGLSWQTSTALTPTPQQDEVMCNLTCPSALPSDEPLQVKAVLQDSQGQVQWQIGGNDEVAVPAGQGSVQFTVYPWFFNVNGTYSYAKKNMFSPQFNNTRNVMVYVPPSYNENPYKTYDNVLVMHDGQNLFDPATSAFGVAWMCQDTINALVNEGGMEEVFIIGVWNTGANRINEYTYSYDKSVGAGGQGDLYLDFLEQQVLPFFAQNYPRAKLGRGNLGILGSSLGGLISCYAGLNRPKVYSIAGCMSSSFWWNNQDFLNVILKKYPTQVPDLTVYLDSGNAGPGKDDLTETIAVRQAMETQGYQLNNTIWYYMQDGGQHGEKFWGERFWVPMTELYPVRARTATPLSPASREQGTQHTKATSVGHGTHDALPVVSSHHVRRPRSVSKPQA